MKHRTHSISQRSRLVIFLLYIIGLFGASWLANGSIIPPLGTEGFWFYSTLPALLLVVLLVTPFFSRPVDSLSYAITALIALLVADIWSTDTTTSLDRSIWVVALCFCVFVVLMTMLTILFYNRGNDQGSRPSKMFYKASIVFGLPEVVYSIVFLFALIAFHRDSTREFIVFGIVWLVIVLALMERLWRYVMRIAKIEPKAEQAIYIGKIIAHNSPNIILIRVIPEQDIKFGDLLLARNEQGRLGVAIALDYTGYNYGRWLRAYHIDFDLNESYENFKTSSVVAENVYSIILEQADENLRKYSEDVGSRFVGLVSVGTTTNELTMELVRNDVDIQQGSVIEVMHNSVKVDYQVIDGVTREEALFNKNTYGYIYVKARKVGYWSDDTERYNSIPWLPQLNHAVMFKPVQMQEPRVENIGYLVNTNHGVRLDLNKLITHNTAILGVLGSGKSLLSIEIVERMIKSNVKVICIDSTPQYSEQLIDYYDSTEDTLLIEEIKTFGPSGKEDHQINVQEGGSIQRFRQSLLKSFANFLSTSNDNMLRIIDPSIFEVWRQDSKMFNDRAAMISLSPSEVTEKITSAILQLLRTQAMTKKAKCCIVYEEAHSLIPEWGSAVNSADKHAASGTARAVMQGRKFGLGCIVVTQRTANVAKSILNQCNTVFSLRVYDNTAKDYLENYFGKDYASSLSSLEDRHAILYGLASSCQVPIQVKLNERDDFTRVFRQNQISNAP